MISKAEAIRQVMKDDLSLSNSEVKRRVQIAYGITVESNQINNMYGAHSKRMHKGAYGRLLAKAVGDFLLQVGGDKHLARNLISSWEPSSMGRTNVT